MKLLRRGELSMAASGGAEGGDEFEFCIVLKFEAKTGTGSCEIDQMDRFEH